MSALLSDAKSIRQSAHPGHVVIPTCSVAGTGIAYQVKTLVGPCNAYTDVASPSTPESPKSPQSGVHFTCKGVLESCANWQKLFAKLASFRKLENGWDGYKAAPPNENAISRAREFMDSLCQNSYSLSNIAPSVVGGVGITLRRGKRKVYVEFSNKGNVHALFSDGETKPIVEKVLPNALGYLVLIAKAKAYLDE